jgi:RNA polymerase sigma factor (sigma-70 family)
VISIVRSSSAPNTTTATHDRFVSMLPQIKLHAHVAFRLRGPEDREDLVQEVIANAYSAFARLVERGKANLAFATPLAQYAIRQVRSGRRVGSKLNQRDAMSPANRRACIERLDRYDPAAGTWRDAVVEDRRATPADTAAARLDLAHWFSLMPVRKRRIAKALAAGETTAAAAKQFGVSSARISQLRQELRQSWRALQGELAVA